MFCDFSLLVLSLFLVLYLLVKIRYGKEQDKRHSSDVNAAYHISIFVRVISEKKSFQSSLISDIPRSQSVSYLPSSGMYRAWRGLPACSVAHGPSRQTSDIRGA